MSSGKRIDCGQHLEASELVACESAVRAGECIVFPTDTVYGIGADAFNPDAVTRLLAVKGRTRQVPSPVLISGAEVLGALASEITPTVAEAIGRFWPGPLTVIVNQQHSLRLDLGDSAGTIAVRVPANELARELLRATGPLAVSSANRHGQPAAVDCQQAIDQFGDSVELYLDGGPTAGSEPSTIVDFTGERPIVRRQGILDLEVLRAVLPDASEPDEV